MEVNCTNCHELWNVAQTTSESPCCGAPLKKKRKPGRLTPAELRTLLQENEEMKIQKTNEVAHVNGLKFLVYGQAGVGKTRLCATTPDRDKTLILSAEAGLLSLRDFGIDFVVIKNIDDMREAHEFLRSGDHDYEWVCIDSASEIAEVCLSEEKKKNKDGRAAYMEMGEIMVNTFRAFRDLPMNVYFSAKLGRVDDDGRQVYGPSFPGRKLEQGVAYLFDEVFVMHADRDEEGNVERSLQTVGDRRYIAKDRSGALDQYEDPSLSRIYRAIVGKVADQDEKPKKKKPKKSKKDKSKKAGKKAKTTPPEQVPGNPSEAPKPTIEDEADPEEYTCQQCGLVDESEVAGIDKPIGMLESGTLMCVECLQEAKKDARNARRREARRKAKEAKEKAKESVEEAIEAGDTERNAKDGVVETSETDLKKPKVNGLDKIQADALKAAESQQERDCIDLVFTGADDKTLAKAVQGLDARPKTRVRDAYRTYKNHNS